jgi:hypothetical protein
MKIAAACVAFLVAAILLIGACNDYSDDAKATTERIDRGFAHLHDQAATDRDDAEYSSRQTSEAVRGVVGAAFLMAGLIMVKLERDAEE